MNTAHKSLLALSLWAGMASMAQAQPAAGSGPGAGESMPARMQAHLQSRAANLKAKLQLSPEQDAAWRTYTAAMKTPARVQRPDRAELEMLSTPERLDKMRALRQQHDAAMDQREQATRTFYAGLTPEQKKTFDANTLHPYVRRGPAQQN